MEIDETVIEQEHIDPLSGTTLHIRMKLEETDTILASATGFLYKYEEDVYLITNWHNMSGKNPISRTPLSKHGGIPDTIETLLMPKGFEGYRPNYSLSLYFDEDKTEPKWLVHPVHREKIDVVAIKLEDIPEEAELPPINEYPFRDDFANRVADIVYVLGYPIELDNHGDMPIWKKASIATEPVFDIDELPKLLIDTATRPGMSGSPVISMKDLAFKDGEFTGFLGTCRKFIGVYSGRIGRGEEMAQLGIVWKKEVIEEIISGGEYDNTDFITQ